MKNAEDSILLVLPVPFMCSPDGNLFFEQQACNGVRLWRENFGRVTVAAPLKPGVPPRGEWVPAPQISDLKFVLLPYAYHPVVFFRTLAETRILLAGLIDNSRYLQFAIGGLIGDWATMACLEAIRLKRPYSVWTDTVASEAERIRALSPGSIKARVRSAVTYLPMRMMERRVIKSAALGLFHGDDTYTAYAAFCRVPQLVHDIHLGPDLVLTDEALAIKNVARLGRILQICYAGRVEPQKGPSDWVDALEIAKKSGARFSAQWVGDGSLLDSMRKKVKELGLQSIVEFVGRVDHSHSLKAIKAADIMLFCHKTPESPRCLIEALMSGTPIVGYESPFPKDLISANRGGVLTKRNDVEALAKAVIDISRDPARLNDLSIRSRNDGSKFSDVSVFKHRSELIKQFL